ncbi:PHP domain-containing protein [Petroclostridium sp. X23]|uniref:PHP domain-containing protein n=1 Tax=Petroclostridium sp. X23 TaxID=3045146 RepID=UPI0024AE7E35|nr:PHP domain-containing protein [Petroclostridium sp. X23]WHH59918.1 PHP domain-containing protein [Petroclostridium sp. X23]
MMTYRPEYLCDLHCHTNMSDGNDTYQQFIDNAVDLGMKVVAITDHDVVPKAAMQIGDQSIATVEYGRQKNVNVLLGIEYSCDSDVDDVHIVGLGCDWTTEDFAVEEENMKRSKTEAYRKLTEVLSNNGIKISWQELLENNGEFRAPEEIQRKHIFEAIADKGYTPTWKEAKIMVRDNPEYNIKREKINPIKAIDIIHKAGGIAILAHPYLIDEVIYKSNKQIHRKEYIRHLIDVGLDGIEAAYTYSKTSYKGNMSEQQVEKEIIDMYSPILKIISGGSDYHNDGKKGTKNPRMIGEKGVTLEYFMNNIYLSALLSKEKKV